MEVDVRAEALAAVVEADEAPAAVVLVVAVAEEAEAVAAAVVAVDETATVAIEAAVVVAGNSQLRSNMKHRKIMKNGESKRLPFFVVRWRDSSCPTRSPLVIGPGSKRDSASDYLPQHSCDGPINQS